MKKMFFAIMLILRPLGYRRMPIRRERLCEEQMRDRRTYKTSDRGIHTSSGFQCQRQARHRILLDYRTQKKVPATVRQEVANTLAKAYMAHLAGDERMPEDYPAELKRACKSLRHYSWKYAYALDKLGHYLYKDLGVDDNKVTIEW